MQASHLWVELRSRLIEKKGIFRHSPSPITYLLVDYYAHIFKQSIDLLVVQAMLLRRRLACYGVLIDSMNSLDPSWKLQRHSLSSCFLVCQMFIDLFGFVCIDELLNYWSIYWFSFISAQSCRKVYCYWFSPELGAY